MLNAVIFDFDGVIVDSEPLHYQAFQAVLQPHDLGYSWNEYLEHYIGFDDRDAFLYAFQTAGLNLSPEKLHDLIDLKAKAFLDIVATGVKAYPGVVELIRSLQGRFAVALCSGALRSDIDPILEQLGLQGCFEIIVTAEDVSASKPSPESYLLCLKRLQEARSGDGITASTTLAIEDTPAGITSARGAGLNVVGVTNSFDAEHLGDAQKIVTSLEHLAVANLTFPTGSET